jgi:hypothetical protein
LGATLVDFKRTTNYSRETYTHTIFCYFGVAELGDTLVKLRCGRFL